jgi:hypothetical protein
MMGKPRNFKCPLTNEPIDDIGEFLDAGWAARVASLGWGPFDLFGCDWDRPLARIDHAGFCGCSGDMLVELNRHTAVIKRRIGAPHTFRRRPVAVGEIVLAWELVPERQNAVAEV